MQTFLPYPDFYKSAECLDWQYSHNRLNNQINEGILIAQSLLGLAKETNHPVIRMWKGCEYRLLEYTWTCLRVWCKRKDINLDSEPRHKLIAKYSWLPSIVCTQEFIPGWLGHEDFHSSHRSILLAKSPEWYSQFGWTEEPAQRHPETKRWPYIWPVK